MTASVWPVLYNFGTTRVETDDEARATLLYYEEVAACPDALRLTIEGFTDATARLASNGTTEVSSRRLAPDRFVTRIVHHPRG